MDSTERFERFIKAMGELQMVCQGDLSDEKIAAYYNRLQAYSTEQLVGACDRLGNEPGRVFFPSVGEFVQALEGTRKGNGAAAWMEFSEMAGSFVGDQYHGRDNPPQTDDPAAQRAIRACWHDMCTQPNEQQQWVQKRFESAYEAAADVISREGNPSLSFEDLKRVAAEKKALRLESDDAS